MKHVKALMIVCAIFLWAGKVYALSGDVSGVWSSGSRITIDGDVTVPAGQTLTIEPGTEIVFNGWYTFTVYGMNTRGGGVWIDNCSPTVRYCIMTHNYSRNENRNGCGGGICLSSASNSVIEFNTISGNWADSGGGIFKGCYPHGPLTFAWAVLFLCRALVLIFLRNM